MILKYLKPLSILLLVVSLSSCSKNLKVMASKADPAKLTKYKTYAWIAPGDSAFNSRRDDKVYAAVIEEAANAELMAKGMLMDTQSPDVVFMFDTRIDEKVQYRSKPTNNNDALHLGGYHYGYGGTGYYAGVYNPMAGLETSHIVVEEGTLSYSMFDQKTGEHIWQGWAKKTLSPKTNVPAVIKKTTRAIFKKLPIKHKD
jgi:hypothetical protein